MTGTRLSRCFSAGQRYKQQDLDRMRELGELVIRTISPFERLRRLTAAEQAVISAARTIHCHIRPDATGELHLWQSAQMELEEVSATNGHGGA